MPGVKKVGESYSLVYNGSKMRVGPDRVVRFSADMCPVEDAAGISAERAAHITREVLKRVDKAALR